MSFPTDEQLTAELRRLYAAEHPGSPEPYLAVEQEIPERITYLVSVGSTTKAVTVTLADMMGPMTYISSVLLKRQVRRKAVI